MKLGLPVARVVLLTLGAAAVLGCPVLLAMRLLELSWLLPIVIPGGLMMLLSLYMLAL